MKYTFKDLSEEEIFKSTSKQLQEKTEKIKEIYEELSKIAEIITEKKLSEIAIAYDIKNIGVEPSYIRTEKGFNIYYKILINDYNPNKLKENFSELKEKNKKINNELKPLNFLIKKHIFFNISKKLNNNFSEENFYIYNKNKIDYCTFQELKEQIQKLTPEQLQEKIEEIGKIFEELTKISKVITEKKIAEIIANYDIKIIEIEPYFSRIDKSFDHDIEIKIDYIPYEEKSKMVPKSFKSAKNISFYGLEQKINNELTLLKPFFKEKINFNVSELKIKHIYYKLEKDLSRKNSQTRPLRYKM